MPVPDTTVEDLIDPVCALADLRPQNDWPDEVKTLVAYARKVKKRYGFKVVTFSLRD